MEVTLAEDVHMAWIRRDIVVLSVREDAYACLVGAADVIRPTLSGALHVLHEDAARDLHQAGLIALHPPTGPLPAAIPPASDLHGGSTSLLACGAFLVSSLWLGRRYHRKPLVAILATARAMRPHNPRRLTDARLRRFAATFERAIPWLPRQEACLHRAFLLFSLLARHGVACDWVFGVRTWPFLAHCWIQVGEVVVGDDLERVRRYTPILVV